MKEDIISIIFFLGLIMIGALYSIYLYGCNNFMFYLIISFSAVLCIATIYLYKQDK